MKLRTLKPAVRNLTPPAARRGGSADIRMAGRRLQDRRLKMWVKSPVCASCGKVVDYPNGFELDHKVRLSDGGADTEDNCQILCNWFDERGEKKGCHVEKTAVEGGGR